MGKSQTYKKFVKTGKGNNMNLKYFIEKSLLLEDDKSLDIGTSSGIGKPFTDKTRESPYFKKRDAVIDAVKNDFRYFDIEDSELKSMVDNAAYDTVYDNMVKDAEEALPWLLNKIQSYVGKDRIQYAHRIKSKTSFNRKAQTANGSRFLDDVVGASVIFDSYDDFKNVAKQLKKDKTIVRIADMSSILEYNAYHVDFKAPNGIYAECMFLTLVSYGMKGFAFHYIYECARDMRLIAQFSKDKKDIELANRLSTELMDFTDILFSIGNKLDRENKKISINSLPRLDKTTYQQVIRLLTKYEHLAEEFTRSLKRIEEYQNYKVKYLPNLKGVDVSKAFTQ